MQAVDIPSNLETAVDHHRAGRLPEAEALYRAILETDPNQPDALHMLGALALQSDRAADAIGLIRQAIMVNGKNVKYHTTLGHALLQFGRLEEALLSFRTATSVGPDFVPAHFLNGVTLRDLGRAEEACAAFELALRLDPRFVPAAFNLAAILQDRGDLPGAIERYRALLALDPDFAAAHLNLGICLARQGDPTGALPHLERAAALEPELVEAQAALGNVRLELGDTERAIESYRAALAINPEAAHVHVNLGHAFRRQRRVEAALMAYRDALAAAPQMADAMVGAAAACFELERYDEAERRYREAVAAIPRAALAWAGLGMTLRQKGAEAEALAAAERAVALDDRAAEANCALGLCLRDRGQFEAAAAAFQRALAATPDDPTVLFHLANLHEMALSEAELARIEGALTRPQLMREQRVDLNFALGRLYDDRGDYDKAFAYFKAGNDLKATALAWDEDDLRSHIDALISIFDKAFFEARAKIGSTSERPVFVLGMPRSGTTLIEQILASHPMVHGSGELAATNLLIAGLERLPAATRARKTYPEAAALLDPASAEALASLYLAATGKEAGEASRVTDKMTGNFQRIGLIALLLPRAQIIHCRRDPLDTCLSCYFQNFKEPAPFTTELGRIGRYYREYERIMAHWRAVLPNRMLEVPYEALVAEPEAWSRRILEHCGLPWDDRVLRFFAAERTVRTASVWQVRQPIYLSSVGRWKHYRRHLGPLFEALGATPPEDAAS
jgi:tetratricopeptide (TPR) repeat protein